MLIACDVDEVVADLLTAWLRRYNRAFDDSKTLEDMKYWDMKKNVKPECGAQIYDILREGNIYDEVLPIPGAVEAVKLLRKYCGHRVVFVSSCIRGSMDAKLDWLIRWGFLPEKHNQEDFIAAVDKHLIAADLLIDDRLENIQKFPKAGILVDYPHNRDVPEGFHATRVPSLVWVPAAIHRVFGAIQR